MLGHTSRNHLTESMITLLSTRQPADRRGGRPINMRRDAAGILRLLDVAFGNELDAENRRNLQRSLVMVSQPWYRPFVVSTLGDVPGFVWEEAGRIVGNVSIMSTREPGRHIIANVAVHPDWRRRGIARDLMRMSMHHLSTLGASTVMLQVKAHNQGAQQLYTTLGYDTIGAISSWLGRPTSLAAPPARAADVPIRPLRSREWRAAYQLDQTSMHADLNWPDPLRPEAYKSGLLSRMWQTLSGRQTEHWVTDNGNGQLTGLASIRSEWARPHALTVRVHPDSRGFLERPLLAKLLRRLTYLPRRRVRVDHPADDALMATLLEDARFRCQRTLVVMRYDFGPQTT
jgi:ribosomal protein S18 acetylase RimI-like enzyme